MKFFRKYQKYILVALLPLLLGLFLNFSNNGHYHRLADGSIIYHAHPYSKNAENPEPGNSGHQHTECQLACILQITKVLHSGILGFFMLGIVFLPFLFIYRQVAQNLTIIEPVLLVSSRGPPHA
jgi:hypothetical protein